MVVVRRLIDRRVRHLTRPLTHSFVAVSPPTIADNTKLFGPYFRPPFRRRLASFYDPTQVATLRLVVWISRPASSLAAFFLGNVLVKSTSLTYSHTALDPLFFLHSLSFTLSLSQTPCLCYHRAPRPHGSSRQRRRHPTSTSPIQIYSNSGT